MYCLSRDDVSLVLQEYPEERIKLMKQGERKRRISKGRKRSLSARLLHQSEQEEEEEKNEEVNDDDGIMETLSFDDKVYSRSIVSEIHSFSSGC